MDEEAIPLDKLAQIYRKIREKIDVLTKEYDTQVETLKAQQDEIKFALKDQMKAMGVKSVQTTYGTVSLVTKTRYSTQDWDSFKRFVIEHEVVDLLEKLIAQTNMANFLEENPDQAKQIIGKAILAVRARKAAKAAKDSILRKGALEGMTLPGKLADCQTKSAEEAEIFLVEGDSAGGTAKTGRDRRTQAILPLRGKILNIERARLDKMLASEQIRNLVVAMGTAIGDTFDISKLRYHKIVIMCDADVDGSHITTLILTFFFRYMKDLVEKGNIYIAQPPLYLVKKGKEQQYCWNDQQREAATLALAKGGNTDNVVVQRYKGLGEMNSEQLWETTMNPDTRTLKQVNIESAATADHIFSMLMGDEVPPRREFIEANAKYARVDAS